MAPAARLRLVYFLYYGNVGAFMPFFAPYLRGLGFTGEQIGGVQMLPSLMSPVVATAWAAWADRHAGPARALALATGWAAIAGLALPFARTPAAMGLVVAAMSLGDRSVVPLVDSVTLEHCRARPGASYARIRLFGSLGFVVLALGTGWVLSARGSRTADPLVPVIVTVLVAGYALAARRLPATPAHADRPGPRDMLALLSDRRLGLLLGGCAVHWMACAPFHLLFGVFVRDRGLPADVAGLGMATGVAAEIGALLLFPRLEARFGLRALFATAFLGSAVRWALLAGARGAPAIVLLQLLHGLTFGLFWGSATAAMGALVPGRLRATGQALFTAIVFGAGNGLGYGLAGAGYDRYGSVGPLFAWAAGLELALGIAAMTVLGRALSAPSTTRTRGGG
ncbi:MFS transporter [Anaeromyxobacter oryzae]|uniref:MFS metabolite transporter n=1 Tax=Anaeromyxobacter oryzae TaxID=2918170 RepID=A0ABN6MNN3_9BACT|nr:MFS transporter [Anaeromyxobacter oryzae]BDG02606.1 MFS metabolite transporter [Anaeromyxobacter oryzae]